MPLNIPPLWRLQQLESFGYPITAVAATQGTKTHLLEIKKILTGQGDFLSRIFVHVTGSLVKGGATAGTATGVDNPTGGFLVQSLLTTQPIYANVTPWNNVNNRTQRIDAMYNRGWNLSQTAITDATGTVPVDVWYEFNLRRADLIAQGGIEYSLAMGRYTSCLLNLTFGGHDQLFSGGGITWDMTGLTVDIWGDIDSGTNPPFIHASEVFENNYAFPSSNSNYQITDLAPGFIYTDFYVMTEDAGALTDGVLNSIAIRSGGQTWLFAAPNDASAIRQMFSKSNNREISDPSVTLTGLYVLPMRDASFLRGFDARFAPLTVNLNVTSLSSTTNVRLGGRRMVPGAVYTAPNALQKTQS